MKEKNPVISVVLTVYNREKYLKRAVDSLLAQDFGDWELIAVNDGSGDGSLKILESYRNSVERLKIITQENRGLPYSRNVGINASGGEYVTFLDADDEYTKGHLGKRVEYMNSHPEVDLIHGGVKIIGNEFVKDKNDPSKMIHISQCTVGGTFFGRREVFLNLGGFKNVKYSEDSELYERAVKKYNVKKVGFRTYIYHRDVPDSITNTYSP